MHLVASAAVCLIAVVAFSHVGVHGGPVPSEPDVGPRECDSRLETCAGDFADAIREEKDIQKLCSHAKVLSTCLDNLGCQLPLHKEQEFRDGLKMWIKQRTPDCSLLQTDLATEHSTTLSAIDCIPQIEASRCEKIFGAAIQSEENPAIVCLHAKAYANCIENLKCPISPDEKKGLFSMLQNFVDTVFPGCSLGPDSTEHTTAAAITTEDRATSLAAAITTEDRATSLAAAITTEDRATSLAAAITTEDRATSLAAAITTEDRATSLAAAITAITTEDMPTPDCLNKVRECADRLQQDLSSMVFSPDNYCSAANFFASCILKIDCTLGKEFKQQMIDAISSSVVNMAPDCKINTDVVEQTTEASITTINSTDFKMSGSSDCLSQIQECFNEYQKELTSGQLNLLCSSAKTFVSCVHNSECPHQEQAKQNAIEGFQTAILNVVPDCDINAVGPDDVEQTTEALSTAVDDIDFTTSVSPDCLSQIQECFNEYQKELTSGQLNLLCSSAKTFVSCVHNSECSHQEDAKQNAIEGFQTAILSVVPGCEINAIELDDGEQTTKSFITSVASSGFMTTGPSDCLLKIQGCFNNYQLDMTSGGFRPDLFCSFGKSFLSCVSSLECPNDEKAKQEAIDGFAPALLITTPDCDLSEIIKPRPDAAEQTTEAVTTTAGSTDLKVSSFSKSPTSTPDADTQTTAATEIAVDSTSSLVSGALNCLSQIQECNNNFQAAVSTSLFNKDVICSSTQSFVKCLMKVGCPIDPEVKKEALASITSTVLKIAPNCELPGVEPDTVKQTTEGLPMSKDTTVFFVNVSSENSCVNEVRTCQQTLFEAVTKPDFKKDEFCGLLKTMINCIGNISCGLTAEKKQEIYDISIKTAAEGGIFCAEPTGVTTESGASITDSIDILGICIDTRNVCLENFRDGINQNPENATNICQNMNTYIACYLAAPCPVSAEDKQIFLNKAQAMVNKSSLPCDFSSVTEGNPTSPLPTVVTTGEDQNSGEPTNLTTPEDVCLLKDFTCKKEFRTSSRSADKSPESICKYVNTYVSCLLSMPRCKSPEEKEELKESAMKFIEPKAPNCILDAFTEKPTTTEASSTTVADCQSLLDACSTSYEERGSKLMSPETACSNAKDYISCVYALPCLMAKAQREDIFENAKAVLFYSSPNCDIDTHQEELLAQEKEQTTESSLSSTLTDLLSMDTEEQTTTELATPTAANTQMESEKQTTADLGTTVADIATTLVSSVTDFDPFAPKCSDGLQKCMAVFTPKMATLTSIDSLCTAIDELHSCIQNMICPKELKNEALSKIRTQLYALSNPCPFPTPETSDMSKSTADIDKAATTVSVTTAEESATSTLGNTATETSLATDTPIPTASPHTVVTDQKSSPKDEDQTTLVSASASDASVTGDADVTDVTASETVEENTSDVTAADKTDEPETTATFDNTTTVTIDSIENVEVIDLKAEFLKGKKVLVSWRLSTQTRPSSLIGFTVLYKLVSGDEFTVQQIAGDLSASGEYSTELDLMGRKKYIILVQPFSQEMSGKRSKPIVFFVTGKKMYPTAQLRISATPLGKNAVIVNYNAFGNAKLSKATIYYRRKTVPQWTPVQRHIIGLRGNQSVVLSRLNEGTTYYVMVKALVGAVPKVAIVSVATLASDPSGDVSIIKHQEEGVAVVDWSYFGMELVQGYKATVKYNLHDPSLRRTEVQYLPSDQTKLEFADNGDTVDYVKIEPFDAHGLKKGAEVRCVRCNNIP